MSADWDRQRLDRRPRRAGEPGGRRARGTKIGDMALTHHANDAIPFVAGVLGGFTPTVEEQKIGSPTACPSCVQSMTEQSGSRKSFCTNVT